MSFGAPLLLLLLPALVPVVVALVWLARWRRVAVRRLVSGAGGGGSARRRTVKAVLVLAGLALIAVAAARPQRGERRVLLPRDGTDVIIALDVSVSMLATDVAPNRFERAKEVLSALLDRLQGDRVGLVVFAGTAMRRFPLSTDITAARELIRSTAIKEGGLGAGTGIGDAVRVAATSFPADDQTRSKVIVLVSDGEDLAGAPQDAVRTARDRGVIIYTLGVGTEEGGAIVIPRPTGTPERRVDPATGGPAISRRDESVLRSLASAGRGRYIDANEGDPAAAIAEEIGRLARTRFESREGSVPIERFQWLVVAALLLLAGEFLIAETPRRRARAAGDRAGVPVRRGKAA
jgi:Ca-activated chloride channel family protein